MVCMSGPIFVQNLIRMCKKKATEIFFVSDETQLDEYTTHTPPPINVCGGEYVKKLKKMKNVVNC